MRVAIRADASRRIGGGHVARCVTLGRELVRRGATITFIARHHEAGWYARVIDAGFDLRLLPAPDRTPATIADGDYAAWLGVDVEQDAAETLEHLEADDYGLLVVDHYSLDSRWEQRVRPAVGRVLAIDDLPDRGHAVDVVVDQNLGAERRAAPDVGDDTSTRRLLGPRYAMLDRQYLTARSLSMPSKTKRPRILVYLGGGDLHGFSLRALEALSRPSLRDIEVDLVVSSASPVSAQVQALATRRDGCRLWSEVEQLAGLLLACDASIGAGGATAWERACLGVPTVLVSVADNQVTNCEELARAGAATYLGAAQEVADTDLHDALVRLIEDHEFRAEQARRSRELVDGAGVLRVAEVLMPSRVEEVKVRPDRPSSQGDVADMADRSAAYRLAIGELEVGTAQVGEGPAARLVDLDLDPEICGRGWTEHLLWEVRDAHERLMRSVQAAPVRQPICGLARLSSKPGVAVVSGADSWINDYLPELLDGWLDEGLRVDWRHRVEEVADSDVCFYLSYTRIVDAQQRSRHARNLVVHESALPQGRGWSPLTWSVLAGAPQVTVTLFAAVDEVDAGDIYAQRMIELWGTELVDELRQAQAQATFELCRWAVNRLGDLPRFAQAQAGQPSWLPRRRPDDSRLDPHRSISEQFDLLRVVDNERYPAFFEHRGGKYRIRIDRLEDTTGAE